MQLSFFFLLVAMSFALPTNSLEKKNKELSRTNGVLLQALKELQTEKAVADPWGEMYSGPSRDCYSFNKNCNGCRGYLSSCCSDKNCAGGRKCKAGIWSYSCDSTGAEEAVSDWDSLDGNDGAFDFDSEDRHSGYHSGWDSAEKAEEEAVGLTCSKDGFEGTVTTDSWCDKRDNVWMHKCSGCKHGYYWYWWHTYCCTPGKSGCTCAYN